MSKFVHMELNTSDPKAAKQFYKGVFGWKYQDMKMSDGGVYSMIMSPEEGIGGIMQNPSPDAPNQWLGYVGVDSVKRTTAKIEKRGGKIMVPATEIPGMGWFAVCLDPQGVAFAIWENAPQAAAQAEAKPATKKKAAKKKATKKKATKKKAAKKKAAKKKAAKKKSAKK